MTSYLTSFTCKHSCNWPDINSRSRSDAMERGRPTVGIMSVSKISITPSASISAVQGMMSVYPECLSTMFRTLNRVINDASVYQKVSIKGINLVQLTINCFKYRKSIPISIHGLVGTLSPVRRLTRF